MTSTDAHSAAPLPVVLVDDEEEVLFSAATLLRTANITPVKTLADGRELLPFLERHSAAVVVLDLFMPHSPGAELLDRVVSRFPEIPVVVMTADQGVESAVACMKTGARDYLVKPVEKNRFISCIQRAMEVRALRQEMDNLKRYLLSDHLEHGEAFDAILTRSRRMRGIFQYMEAISQSTEPVLIQGETGVGKELLAEAVHKLSGRSGDLVALNVAGLDDNMFSDTLFGHRKGAFTGANENREGLIVKAAGGTLFLDEIGDLNPLSQVKLLRLLQERKFYPLGADGYLKTDARIVCATNQALKQQMSSGGFRSDLYFRLSAHRIQVPPLRERKEDIPLLTGFFLQEAALSMGKPQPMPPPELFQLLHAYDFPGNIRELRAMVYDAVAQHKSGILSMDRFRETVFQTGGDCDPTPIETNPFTNLPGRLPTFKEVESLLLDEAMGRAKGNKSIAAALLGVSRQTLNYRLRQQQSGGGGADDGG